MFGQYDPKDSVHGDKKGKEHLQGLAQFINKKQLQM